MFLKQLFLVFLGLSAGGVIAAGVLHFWQSSAFSAADWKDPYK